MFYYSIATFVFTAVIFALTVPIKKASYVPAEIFTETINFFRIYVVASGVGVVSKYLYTFSVITKQAKQMFMYFITKAIITSILFLIFIPNFCLGLGAVGGAISELVVNSTTTIYLAFKLPKTMHQQTIFDKKQYFKLIGFAFAETIIRNVVYYCVVLVMLNMLDNQNLYFVSNEYIWSFLLVPTLAQSSLIKQNIAQNKNLSLKPYFINSILLVCFMIVLLPLALVLFDKVYNLLILWTIFMFCLNLFLSILYLSLTLLSKRTLYLQARCYIY